MSDYKLDEILNKLNKLEEEFKNYKTSIDDIIIMNTTLVQELANQINTKMDIIYNIETPNSTNSKQASNKTKSLTKTSFFKDKMKQNINEYINILYTKEELDDYYSHPDVKLKKTDNAKKTKIIELLYVHITKNDENKHNKLKELFDEYKKNIDNIYQSDEETKTNE